MGNFFSGLKFSNFLPVVGGLIDGALGAITGNAAANKEITAQKEMQQASFKQQEYLLDKMNSYNTPAMQMQRYRDAGINPYAILGQVGAGNQTSSGSVPSYPQRVPSGLRTLEKYNLIQQGLSIAAQQAAIKKSNASAKVDDAQANYINERSKAQEYENKGNELQYRVDSMVVSLLDQNMSYDGIHSNNYLMMDEVVRHIAEMKIFGKLLNSKKNILLDSLQLGHDNSAAEVEFSKIFVPETEGNAILDAKKKLADTLRSETLSSYQESLIVSTLTTQSLQQTLLDTRNESIAQQIEFRYQAWNYLLNQEKFKAANLEERNKIMQSTVEIMNNKAYYSSYNELMNAINNTVEIAASAVGAVKSAVSKQRSVTNIRSQTNINNNNSFDGTIPY